MNTFNVALHIKAKHGALYKHIQERGMTQTDFAKIINVGGSTVCKWFNLKDYPRSKESMNKICTYLKVLPENLFPNFCRDKKFLAIHKECVVYQEIPVDFLPFNKIKELPYIDYNSPENQYAVKEREENILHILKTLTPKEDLIIRLAFGIGEEKALTYDQISTKLRLSKGRVLQIHAKAIRKLKHPHRLEQLRKV